MVSDIIGRTPTPKLNEAVVLIFNLIKDDVNEVKLHEPSVNFNLVNWPGPIGQGGSEESNDKNLVSLSSPLVIILSTKD